MFEQIKQAFGIGVDPNAMNETYGVPESVVRQARGNQMAQLGANIYAMSQQLTPSQRAQVAQNMASQGNDFQKNIYNAAQSRLMQQRIELANQKGAREREALARLQEQLEAAPDSPQRRQALAYLGMGDATNAIKAYYNAPKPSATAEKVQMLLQANPGMSEADAINQVVKSSGTTINNNMGTGAWDEVNKAYAKEEYIPWVSGGGADAARQLGQISSVLEKLERGEPLTGPMQGAIQGIPGAGDLIAAILTPNAVAARDNVGEVVQRNLKAILGSQFTANEGAQLVARAFNPSLGPQENARRLRMLIAQMQAAAQAKNEMATYFQQNDGSLRGYRGRQYGIGDFMMMFDPAPSERRGDRLDPQVLRDFNQYGGQQ